MRISPDGNGTCTLAVLKGFGEGQPYGNEDHLAYKTPPRFSSGDFNTDNSFMTFLQGLKDSAAVFDANRTELTHLANIATIMATTSNLQTYAEEYLQKIGFKRVSGPTHSGKYQTMSMMSIWTMNALEFCKAIDYKSKYGYPKLERVKWRWARGD